MVEVKSFEMPEWLKNQSVDENQKKLMGMIPDRFDKSKGGVPWNFVFPTAYTKSELMQFTFVEMLKNMFPQWAYGKFLDYHADLRNLKRKAAIQADVVIRVTGTPGTMIPQFFSFSTASTVDVESLQYITNEEAIIADTGVANIPSKAVIAGKNGNVTPNTIIMMTRPLEGIFEVTNPSSAVGGDDIEDDESLRQRILEYDQNKGVSFVGSVSDYKRWAEGFEDENITERVGNATVIEPTYAEDVENSEKIKIVITNSEGKPASEELCKGVYNFIMQPDNPPERLAPVNAQIMVIPPEEISLYIRGKIELVNGFILEDVAKLIVSKLQQFLLKTTGEIKYSEVCKLIISTDGVYDYEGIEICSDGVSYSTSNIELVYGSIAATGDDKVVFSSV